MKQTQPLQTQLVAHQQMIADLARQSQQTAVNHAQLLGMVLQLQLQIDQLAEQIREL